MEKYLASTQYIDWQHPEILAQAKVLAAGKEQMQQIAEACFNFVRDDIKHSGDYQLNPITCKASDVLKYATGYCYAKSHLLAALLRANAIPAGLCYQRLILNRDASTFCLHGLNAIYLDACGWYRVDARGNKQNITTAFSPPEEQLAFSISIKGEADLPEIWSEPLAVVIESLTMHNNYVAFSNNLPDIVLYDK